MNECGDPIDQPRAKPTARSMLNADAAASLPPHDCAVVMQVSRKPCVANATYGCSNGSIWSKGCRGHLRCAACHSGAIVWCSSTGPASAVVCTSAVHPVTQTDEDLVAPFNGSATLPKVQPRRVIDLAGPAGSIRHCDHSGYTLDEVLSHRSRLLLTSVPHVRIITPCVCAEQSLRRHLHF